MRIPKCAPAATSQACWSRDDVWRKRCWRWIYSYNSLERLNKELKRRTNVVGIFPNRDAVIRPVGALLIELDDEWQIGRRYFSLASMKELWLPDDVTKLAALPIPLVPVHWRSLVVKEET